ncbi:MAG TPA: MarR family winged helix-turn-helix transcriptional regulator [Acidimicrobiales bacterium]|nr:MarR family winged helix-turn-helix transcriptional regulator [Acidimicrobiales bacterium]
MVETAKAPGSHRAEVPGDVAGVPGTPPPAGSVGFLLSQLGAAGSRGFGMQLAPLGIEPRQFAMLRYIASAEGQSQQALGSALHIPASRMVALVDELEERGLLERRPNPADRRSHALFLTGKGRRLLDKAFEIANAHEAMVCGTLTQKERAELLSLLHKVGGCLGVTTGVHPELTRPAGDADPD